MRSEAEIRAEKKKLEEEAKRFNDPFFHKDEVAVRFAIQKLKWVLGEV